MWYRLTVLLSAFLLFIVQLMMGRQLLPWFGGTAAVWTTCMLFFQVLLLAGYAYAHGIATRLTPRRQALAHGGLLLIAVAVLAVHARRWGSPLLPPAALVPRAVDAPIASILGLLAVSAGWPFLALAATSPLLQRWHSLSAESEHASYRLYALSNAGSAAGLLCYPFVVEPALGLPAQAGAWCALFAPT